MIVDVYAYGIAGCGTVAIVLPTFPATRGGEIVFGEQVRYVWDERARRVPR